MKIVIDCKGPEGQESQQDISTPGFTQTLSKLPEFIPPLVADTLDLDAIRQQAYESFIQFYDGRRVENDTELESALKEYTVDAFQKDFSLKFYQDPPDSLRADGAEDAFVDRNLKLCFFVNPNFYDDSLRDYVDHQVFSGLDVKPPSVKNYAVDFVTGYFRIGLRLDLLCKQWYSYARLFATYIPDDPTVNAVRERTTYYCWNNNNSNDGQTVAYIFVITESYEILPAEQRAVKALFRLLCNNLAARLQLPYEIPSADEIYLKDMLFEYTKEQFKQGFNFEYAGVHTKPPDAHGSAIKAYAELFQVNHEDVPASQVGDWLDAEVFKKDSKTFPDFANDSIWEGIRDTAVQCIVESRSKLDWWFLTRETKVYENPEHGDGIKQYAIYAYAMGDMRHPDAEVVRTFVYYLGVFCGVAP